MDSRKPVKPSKHRSYCYILSKRYSGDLQEIYDSLDDSLEVSDKRKGPYKKQFGFKDQGDPCHFEITKKNLVVSVYPFKENWKTWLRDNLVKYEIKEDQATKLSKNLIREIGTSHFVFEDVGIAPYLRGKVWKDKTSGITLKFGDESHPNNLEIEVDHEIKQEIRELKHGIKEILSKVKSPKEPKYLNSLGFEESWEEKWEKEFIKKYDKRINRLRMNGWLLPPIGKISKFKDRDPVLYRTYEIPGAYLQNLFVTERMWYKLLELFRKGKIKRIK
jgi:hypothetical protein